jgi:hypothetical protein
MPEIVEKMKESVSIMNEDTQSYKVWIDFSKRGCDGF